MFKIRSLLYFLFICAFTFGCQRLSNSSKQQLIGCGPDATDEFSRYIPIVGLNSSENLNAYSVNAMGESRNLTITQKGCVVLPRNLGEDGWMIITIRKSGLYGFLSPLEKMQDYEKINLDPISQENVQVSCPKTPGHEVWYGNRFLDLRSTIPPSKNFFLSYQLIDELQGKSVNPVPLKDAYSILQTSHSLVGLPSGSYRLNLTAFDFFAVGSPGFRKDIVCTILIDHEPPVPRTTISRRVGPGELINIEPVDLSPVKTFSCWSELKNPENIGGAESCVEMKDSGSLLVSPGYGSWVLQYYFEDLAGNRSNVFRESVSVFNQSAVERVRSLINDANLLFQNGDAMASLHKLTAAAIKRSGLKSSEENQVIGHEITMGFIRHALAGSITQKIRVHSADASFPLGDGKSIHIDTNIPSDGSVQLESSARIILLGHSGKVELERVVPSEIESTAIGMTKTQSKLLFSTSYKHGLEVIDWSLRTLAKLPWPGGTCESKFWNCEIFSSPDGRRIALSSLAPDAEIPRIFYAELKDLSTGWLEVPVPADFHRAIVKRITNNGKYLVGARHLIDLDSGLATRIPYAELKALYDGNVCTMKLLNLKCYKNLAFDASPIVDIHNVVDFVASESGRFLAVTFIESSVKKTTYLDMRYLNSGYASTSQDPATDILSLHEAGSSSDVFIASTPRGSHLMDVKSRGKEFKLLDSEGLKYLGFSEACTLGFFQDQRHVYVYDLSKGSAYPFHVIQLYGVKEIACSKKVNEFIFTAITEDDVRMSFDLGKNLYEESKIKYVRESERLPSITPGGRWIELSNQIIDTRFPQEPSLDCEGKSCSVLVDRIFSDRWVKSDGANVKITKADGTEVLIAGQEAIMHQFFAAPDRYVMVSNDFNMSVFDSDSGALVASKKLSDSRGSYFTFSVDQNGRWIVYSQCEQQSCALRVLDIDSLQEKYFLDEIPAQTVIDLKLSPNRRWLAAIWDSEIIAWDLERSKPLSNIVKRQALQSRGRLFEVNFSESGEYVFTQAYLFGSTVFTSWDLSSGNTKVMDAQQSHGATRIGITDWSIVRGSDGNTFRLVDLSSGVLSAVRFKHSSFAIASTQENLYVLNKRGLWILPLKEEIYIARACSILKDYLEYSEEVPPEDRKLCVEFL